MYVTRRTRHPGVAFLTLPGRKIDKAGNCALPDSKLASQNPLQENIRFSHRFSHRHHHQGIDTVGVRYFPQHIRLTRRLQTSLSPTNSPLSSLKFDSAVLVTRGPTTAVCLLASSNFILHSDWSANFK